MNIRIKYENEIPALWFATIACPDCEQEFDAKEHGKTEGGGRLHDYIDLQYGVFKCPNCHLKFTTRDKELKMITS